MEKVRSCFVSLFRDGQVVDLSAKLLGAILVLLFGWILAVLISRAVRLGLKKLPLEKIMPDQGDPAASRGSGTAVAAIVSRMVFYLILLLSFLGFLSVLELSAAAEPIQALLDKILRYGANLLGAGLLLFAAWVAASILRYLSALLLKYLRMDERFSGEKEDGEACCISGTVSEAVYWLVFLCFLPGIFGALKIDGIMEPFKGMMNKAFAYLPNLASGVLIFLIGMFAAKLLKRVVSGLLMSIGADSFTEKTGLSRSFGQKGFSQAVGVIVYALVILPTLAVSLNALQIQALSAPVSNLINKLLSASGNLFGVVLLVFALHVVGRILRMLTTQLLENCGFDKLFVSLGLCKEDSLPAPEKRPSAVLGQLVYVLVLVFAAIASCEILGFVVVGNLIASLLPAAGRILLGLIVFLLGLYFANLTSGLLKSREKYSSPVILIVRFAILLLFGAMALHCMGIADEIIQIAFAAIVGAAAVAFALAFGLGGRDLAAKKLQEWNDSRRK